VVLESTSAPAKGALPWQTRLETPPCPSTAQPAGTKQGISERRWFGKLKETKSKDWPVAKRAGQKKNMVNTQVKTTTSVPPEKKEQQTIQAPQNEEGK